MSHMGIVVETAANIVVVALRNGLVLVVTAAVRKLCRSDVDDALTGAFWYLMDEAQKILIAVTEAHAPAYARLKEARRAGEAEGDHALVLVPDVDHAVQTFVAALNGVYVQEIIPHPTQFGKCLIHCLNCGKATQERVCPFLIYYRRCLPLLFFGILYVAKCEYETATLAWLQLDVQPMCCGWCAA